MLHEASRLPGLTVYTRTGKRLGVVHDVLFDTSQRIVSALLITGTTPKLVKGGANIIVPYRWVQNLDDVVILRHFPDKNSLSMMMKTNSMRASSSRLLTSIFYAPDEGEDLLAP